MNPRSLAARPVLWAFALLLLPSAEPVDTTAPAAEPAVLVLISGEVAAYRQAGEEAISALLASSPGVPVTVISLGGPGGERPAKHALDAGASLVVAIGTRAARLSMAHARDIPVVYAMVLDPSSIGLPGPGATPSQEITGVAMDVAPDQQLSLMRELVPGMSKIGVLYDPGVSGQAVRRASAAARSAGLSLVAQAVRSDAEVMGAAEMVAPGVDALWAIADPTVLTPANARALILFSLRWRKPLFAISEGYVRNGALAALAAHPQEVGRRAGEMASSILSGTPVKMMKPEMPPTISLFLNTETARRLGLMLPDAALSRANAVYPQR